MKRIFFPIETVTIAHVVRPLRVAQALRRQGHEIIFGVHDRCREWVEREGFQTYPLYSENPEVLLNAVRTLDFKKQIDALPKYLESDLQAIEDLSPLDLIVADFRFTIRLAAKKAGVPHIALINGYYSPYYSITPEVPSVLSRYLPPFISGRLTFRKILRQGILKWQAAPYQKLSRRYQTGAEIKNGFDITLSDTLTLICDLPEFTPQNNLPGHYQFTGPILWEPDLPADEFKHIFNDQKRPLIYLTGGTSGDEGAFRHLIHSLGNMPYDVLFSTGRQTYPNLPDNVYAFPFVKASEVLKHASLMICHGGNGSIYQAIQHRVPVLCVTTFYDQEWNGQRVRDLGLGDSLDHRDLIRRPVMPIIEGMIRDPGIQRNLEKFQNLLSQYNGADIAAQKIHSILQGERS